MSIPESPHPYPAASGGTVLSYSYTVPAWPGGLNTIYILFSLDTYPSPIDFGASITVTTDSDAQVFTDVQLSGTTIAIDSTDGVIDIDLTTNGNDTEFYGFRIEEITLASPTYVIGNPHSEDNPPYRGEASPKIIHTSVDLDPEYSRVLMCGQVGAAYGYTLVFRSGSVSAWSIVSGALPAGLTMVSGLISGTPTTEQQADFTVRAVTSHGTIDTKFTILTFLSPAPIDTIQTESAGNGANANWKFHFQYGTSRYAMAEAAPDQQHYGIAVYKSDLSGAVWVRKDQAGEPAPPTGGGLTEAYVYAKFWDGADTIYICYATDITGDVSTVTMKKFDLLTDTWQADFGGSTTLITQSSGGAGYMAMIQLTTGVLRMYFAGALSGGAGSQLYLFGMDNDGVSFSAASTLLTPAGAVSGSASINFGTVTHQPISFPGLSVVDATHIWVTINNAGNSVQYLRVDDVFGTSANFTASTADWGSPDFSGPALLDPDNNSLLQSFLAKTTISARGHARWCPALYRGTPLDAPVTWTLEYVKIPNTLDMMNAATENYNVGLFRTEDDTLSCVWVGRHDALEDPITTSLFVSYYDPDTLAWSAREELWSALTNPYDNPIGSGTPVVVLHAACLQDAPYWMEPVSTGGFFMGFNGSFPSGSAIPVSVFFSRSLPAPPPATGCPVAWLSIREPD